MAANIVASDVTCTDEQNLMIGQALIPLEELIVRAEATLAYLQYALQNATGTTAVFSTNAPTTPITTTPYPGYCPSCPLGSVCTGACFDGTCYGYCASPNTTATPVSCDSGWTLFEHTQKCYSFYTTTKDWTSALSFCKSKTTNPSANLVSIPDQTTNNFLLNTLPSITGNTEVWLGGYRENGQWKWSDGSQWSYTNWYSGKPSAGGNNDYLEFWGQRNSRKWNNAPKSFGRRILCQYDPTQ